MSTETRDEQASSPAADGPGARLKAARERAGLSLDQAAQQLKLAPRQVRALENEDFEHLPGRTFTRGFVRNYARLLNLDAEGLLALMPDAGNAPALEAPTLQSTASMIAELPTGERAAPNFARWLIPLVLVACVVGAASYEWYRGGLTTPGDAVRSRAVKVDPTVETTSPPATQSRPLPNPFAEPPKEAEAAAAPTAHEQKPMAQTTEVASSPAPRASAATPATEAPIADTAQAVSPSGPAAAVPDAPLQLTYRGPSWTEVRDHDGQVLVLRLVPAGSEQALSGTPPFDLVIGNAAAVTLVYRGVAVDLAPFTHQNVARLRLS